MYNLKHRANIDTLSRTTYCYRDKIKDIAGGNGIGNSLLRSWQSFVSRVADIAGK